ncbi:hypothetical protein AYI68_g8094 [Smittium mucronatum]|uniref:Uncharacterized protein n=1 Tax=Smittium mucronatum TaxID=133383 RepID=A0A1R0GLW9_9FUNG|nr:hypothetical protein AYI68_g8094 [Smittium mucronatum]
MADNFELAITTIQRNEKQVSILLIENSIDDSYTLFPFKMPFNCLTGNNCLEILKNPSQSIYSLFKAFTELIETHYFKFRDEWMIIIIMRIMSTEYFLGNDKNLINDIELMEDPSGRRYQVNIDLVLVLKSAMLDMRNGSEDLRDLFYKITKENKYKILSLDLSMIPKSIKINSGINDL